MRVAQYAGSATLCGDTLLMVTDPFDFDESERKVEQSEEKAGNWLKAVWATILYALGVGGPAG